jgi:hypothetical protein
MDRILKNRLRIRLHVALAVSAIWSFCFPGSALSTAKPPDQKPSWSIDLEATIGPFHHFLVSRLSLAPQVAFINDDLLAVSFLDTCSVETPTLSLRTQRKEGKPCPLTLNIFFIETKDGHVHSSLSMPFPLLHQFQPSSPPGQGLRFLLPTRGGEFLVHDGNFLLRYGPNLDLKQKRALDNPDRTVAFVSPSGSLVLLSEYQGVNHFRKFVFPPDDIEAGGLFANGWPGEGVLDDGRVLSFVFTSKLSDVNSIDFKRAKTGIQNCTRLRGDGFCLSVCSAENECNVVGGYGSPIDNTKFAMRDEYKGFAVVDLTGNVLYRGHTAHPVLRLPSASGSIGKFVVQSGTMGAHKGEMTWKFVFDVLDLEDLTRRVRVNWDGIGGTKIPGGVTLRNADVALSRDGSRMAIIVGSELRLYQLPPAKQ